jgi:hypothetical protein
MIDLSQSDSGRNSNVEWIGIVPFPVLLCNVNDDLLLLWAKLFGGIIGSEGSKHMRGHLRVISELAWFEKGESSSSGHFHG